MCLRASLSQCLYTSCGSNALRKSLGRDNLVRPLYSTGKSQNIRYGILNQAQPQGKSEMSKLQGPEAQEKQDLRL